ncbi:MAG: beta-N-acetylhexosaminidase [Pseudomonadota bacterium]
MTLGPVMLAVEGTGLTPADRDLLQQPAVGGVILFKRNFESPQQLQALVQEIQALRSPGLLIAVDQEGGRVQRFGEPFSVLPPAGWFGLIYNQDAAKAKTLARDAGWLMAAELLACGIDLSFAPVLDLHRGVSRVVGDRSLHRKPDAVVSLANSLMHGMREAGMQAVGKHYPGHGAVVADSHEELPVDRREYAQISEDLSVFERMLASGLPAIMTAHVVYSELDSLPASFSEWWLQQELRERIGFRGAVFSDDLSMKATNGFGDIVQRAQAVLQAGTDMLLVCNDRPAAERVVDALREHADPRAMVRLARLRGARNFDGALLRDLPRWQQAQSALSDALGQSLAGSGDW